MEGHTPVAATVLDRLEQLVREVISALRENSQMLGRADSTLTRVNQVLTDLEGEKARANDIEAENVQSAVETRGVWRDAVKTVIVWSRTRTAAVFGTAVANLLLAWFAYWLGVPLPFLPLDAGPTTPVQLSAPIMEVRRVIEPSPPTPSTESTEPVGGDTDG